MAGKTPKAKVAPRSSTYIKRMGVELEGAWGGTSGVPPFADADILHDGSVEGKDGFQHYGEIPSKPLVLRKLLAWVKTHYPHGVNASMGMHVHVSMRDEK